MAWILFIIAVCFAFYYKGVAERVEKLRAMHCRHSQEWEEKYHKLVKEVISKND